MQYWLVKSEPFEYSYEDLEKEGQTVWDGIRNYAARKHLRGMETGDLVLYYHSRKGLEVVGICQVTKTAYPDPTDDTGKWDAVDLVPISRLQNPVALTTIKQTSELQNIGLVRIGRLSVMPLEFPEFKKILALGDTPMPQI